MNRSAPVQGGPTGLRENQLLKKKKIENNEIHQYPTIRRGEIKTEY